MAHRPAKIDHEGMTKAEEHARREDPHGTRPAEQAEQDEPSAWPSPDRNKVETTVARAGTDKPQPDTFGVGDEAAGRISPGAAPAGATDLPARGYPPFEQSVADWFYQKYARAPTERELGLLMSAMAERDATSPRTGPNADAQGSHSDPSAAPTTRR